MSEKTIAIIGATGAIGREMIRTLERRKFPVKELRLFAQGNTNDKFMKFENEDIIVEELNENSFQKQGIDIALFSAGSLVSAKYCRKAADFGSTVIDNSNAWRMDVNVPLIVPEVNPEDINNHNGIIANPNCSTIQMVATLKPLHDFGNIKKIIVSTYQSVSGAGQKGIDELWDQTKDIMEGKNIKISKFPKQIAYNLIPQVDVFMDNYYTKEEMKIVNETAKILHSKDIQITATCVNVPVLRSHGESIYVETERKISRNKAIELFSQFPNLVVMDNKESMIYPTPVEAEDNFETYVGRIREDLSHPRALNFWVVADNILKGAASNAVQIAELLI